MTDLPDLSAAELAQGYRARTFSPVEVTHAVLARIARIDAALHATWGDHREEALAQARAAQARWAAGMPLSVLDGVPVTLKEHLATRGVCQPQGSAASILTPAKADAPPAARLREAGAVFVARTTMPDWGLLSSGLSSFHGVVRNPWDTRCNPGGSSAGAAVAAAVGYGPLHIATDIGGSIRLPAHWCGVIGFKPSWGRVPTLPPYTGRVVGPLARHVADVARVMQVLSQPDGRDATSLPWQPLPWLDLDGFEPRGLRIGVQLDAGWGDPLQACVHSAVSAVARALEQAGAVVEPLGPVSSWDMAHGLDVFWRMRAWMNVQKLPAAHQARILPYVSAWLAPAATLSAAEVFLGHSQMAAMRDRVTTVTQPFDFIVSPVSSDVAFPAEWASPNNDPARPFEHIAYTLPWNMSQQPAIVMNAGLSDTGLPIGVQFIGRRHDDVGVLRLARWWEQQTPTPHLRRLSDF